MALERGLLGKSRVKGLTLQTVEEIEKLRKQYYGLGYDFVHAAASVSRVFGRYIDYVHFETPKKPAYVIVLNMPEEGMKNVHGGLTGLGEKYNGKLFKSIMKNLLNEMGNCDGAIIVDAHGKVARVGAQLINFDTKKILSDRKKELLLQTENANKLLGFGDDVGTRHTSAIVSSHKHPETKIITLSEESGHLRVYEKGRIIASTNEKDRIHKLKRISFKYSSGRSSPLERIVSLASI